MGYGRHIPLQRNQNARNRYQLDNNIKVTTHVKESNPNETWSSHLECGGQTKIH
jgi:hypothetical protein